MPSALALPSARQKTIGKKPFGGCFFAELSLPSAALGKSFAECIWAFAESGSVGIDIVRLAAELLTTMHYICCSFLLI